MGILPLYYKQAAAWLFGKKRTMSGRWLERRVLSNHKYTYRT